MVRNRARTTNRASWNEESLQAAIKDVTINGRKLRESARAYGVPVSTLRDRIKSGNTKTPKLGRNPTFSEAHEKEFKDQVLLLARCFYGITSLELRRLVFEFAEINNIKNDFNKSSRMAGPDWLVSFLRRNPTVSVRTPQATSLNRILGFNYTEVKLFYSNLTTVMDKYKFDGSRIYNYDETGISTVQKPGKILAPKGVKQLGFATSWERGKNITVCCAMSASGAYVPPMFIYPRLRMNPVLGNGGPVNAIYHCSKSGWITEELFPIWLGHFISFAKPTKESPVLLIMDNHTTHTTLAAYNICKDNNIIVVTLPPHSSHRLQPLDVTFYSSLKASFNQECDNFMRSHPHNKITPYEIAAIFNKSFCRVANIEKAVSGFEQTGIYPLDTQKFTEEDFASYPGLEIEIPTVQDNEAQHDINKTSSAMTTPDVEQNDIMPNRPTMPVSCPNGSATLILPGRSEALASTSKAASTPSGIKSFKDISPVPASALQKQNTKSRKQHSSVFTSTPNKTTLEDAAAEKQLKIKLKEERLQRKLAKKNLPKPKGKSKYRKQNSKIKPLTTQDKKKCRRNIHFDYSSDEGAKEEPILNDDEMDDLEPMVLDVPGSTRATTDSSDVCLLCGEFGRNNELWFRCILCSGWVHAECSAAERAENFVCDFCRTN